VASTVILRRAFLVRLAVALVLHVTGWSLMLAPDERTYAGTGLDLARFWVGETFSAPWRVHSNQPQAYFYLNGVSFFLFGSALPLKLLNCLIGAAACRYAALLASSLYSPEVGRRTATLVAFFPSLVLWSAVNIRDVWVIFLILYITWKTHRLVAEYSHRSLVSIIAAILALSWFRQYLFFVVALPPLVGIFVGRRRDLVRSFVLGGLAAIGVIILVQQGSASHAVAMMDLETLAEQRRGLTHAAGSAFEQSADISTPARALAFLPIGIAYFLFSPFPWQITSTLKLLSLPEMLILYALTPAIIRGIKHTIRHRFRAAVQVLLLTALLTVSYSLGSGNVGTLYRHRAQAVAFFLMFGAVGLELSAKRARERQLAALNPSAGARRSRESPRGPVVAGKRL
jgi:hypothetical protein